MLSWMQAQHSKVSPGVNQYCFFFCRKFCSPELLHFDHESFIGFGNGNEQYIQSTFSSTYIHTCMHVYPKYQQYVGLLCYTHLTLPMYIYHITNTVQFCEKLLRCCASLHIYKRSALTVSQKWIFNHTQEGLKHPGYSSTQYDRPIR